MEARLLSQAAECVRIHEGGEAEIFRFSAGGHDYILKWYKAGISLNLDILERIHKIRQEGLYRIQEVGVVEDRAYVIYDYIDGVPSSEFCMPVTVALVAMQKLVQTLGSLHAQDIHHGDLNPANVMLCSQGDALQPILIDCGIVGPGALAYASPERFQGKPPSVNSDTFSQGLLLYRWITGSDLLRAKNFDEYGDASSTISASAITEKLYVSGKFQPEELKSLEPLWKAFLFVDRDAADDYYDELDELLEIAQSQVSGGEIFQIQSIKSFVKDQLGPKLRQKVPQGEKISFSGHIQQKTSKKSRFKLSVLLGGVLILIAVGVLLFFGFRNPDVDDAGDRVLKKSRNLTTLSTDSENAFQDSCEIKADSSLLKDLPIPQKEEQEEGLPL